MVNRIFSVGNGTVDLYKPTIALNRTVVSVDAPYNKTFLEQAGRLGGVFRDGKWLFSYREELDVRKLCEECFGYDGLTEPTKVDVKITFNRTLTSAENRSIDILSRPLARVSMRGGDPLIATGTLIKSGSIVSVGKKVVCKQGTVVEFRAVPAILYKNHRPNPSYSLSLLEVDQQALEILFYEHDQLLNRLVEIKHLISLADKDIAVFADRVAKHHETSFVDDPLNTA